jgi:hypothetical protein
LFFQLEEPGAPQFLLLFTVSLGVWIVELRNRAIFHNLLRRAWQIEEAWRDLAKGELPFYTHMTPRDAARWDERIPERLRTPDQTRVLGFRRFSARLVSHSVGLDILYLSVMGYAMWSFLAVSAPTTAPAGFDPVLALFALAVIALAYKFLSASRKTTGLRAFLFGAIGSLLVIATGLLVWSRAA